MSDKDNIIPFPSLKVFNLSKNTILVSLIATFIIIAISVYFQFLRRIVKNRVLTIFNEAISLTYALPGAVIGLSLIILFSSTPFKSEILIGSFFSKQCFY